MQITYLQGLARAISDAMAADSRVILMGSRLGGHFTIEENEAFAPIHSSYAERIFMNVPIAEFGLAGAAVGVALPGGRPLLSFNIASFMFHGFPPIVNEAPNVHYTTGGQCTAPLTCYALGGIRGGAPSTRTGCRQCWATSRGCRSLPRRRQEMPTDCSSGASSKARTQQFSLPIPSCFSLQKRSIWLHQCCALGQPASAGRE